MCLNRIENREEMKQAVRERGWDHQFFDDLRAEEGNEYFSGSTAWYDDEKYILKCKGKYGNIIIGWEGVHDNG